MALALYIASILCHFFLGTDKHLLHQTDVHIVYAAIMMTVIYGIVWLVIAVKRLHWALRMLIVFGAIINIIIVTFFVYHIGIFEPDTKIWSDNQFVVYHESNNGIEEGHFVLYERDGITEKRLCSLGTSCSNPIKIEYHFNKEQNLITEESDWEFDNRKWHETKYYRLSDGELLNKEQNNQDLDE